MKIPTMSLYLYNIQTCLLYTLHLHLYFYKMMSYGDVFVITMNIHFIFTFLYFLSFYILYCVTICFAYFEIKFFFT